MIKANPSKIKNNNFIAVKANRDMNKMMETMSPTNTSGHSTLRHTP